MLLISCARVYRYNYMFQCTVRHLQLYPTIVKHTFSERKFDVELKYALHFPAWVKAKMFWLKNMLNYVMLITYFGAPYIQRLTHNFQ